MDGKMLGLKRYRNGHYNYETLSVHTTGRVIRTYTTLSSEQKYAATFINLTAAKALSSFGPVCYFWTLENYPTHKYSR